MADDIIATVTYDEVFSSTISSGNDTSVTAVGIQGLSATDINLSNISDVDASNLVNGSVLVYKTHTNKWTSTTTLDAQNMEGGEF